MAIFQFEKFHVSKKKGGKVTLKTLPFFGSLHKHDQKPLSGLNTLDNCNNPHSGRRVMESCIKAWN